MLQRTARRPVGPAPQDLDNVLRLRIARDRQYAPPPAAPALSERRRAPVPDWSATLDAVEEAAEAMMSTENAAKEIEMRGVALAERALAELRSAEERIRAAEEATRRAEARAVEAEARLRDAEEWLNRIQDAVETRLLSRAGESYRFNPHAA